MSIETLTIKFRGQGSQEIWLARLQAVCRHLTDEGVVKTATATAVFPADKERAMASMFTVDVEDAPADVTRFFEPLDGIQYVDRAASRRTLAGA
jgi:hypothetical protein